MLQVLAARWSRKSQHIAAASNDGNIYVGNIEVCRGLRGHTGAVRCVSWSPDSRWIVSAGDDRYIRVLDAHKDLCVKVLPGHSVCSIDWSRDSQWVVTSSWDSSVKLWRVRDWNNVRTLIFPPFNHAKSVCFAPNSQFIAYSGMFAGVVDVSELDPVQNIESGHDVEKMAWSPDSQFVACTFSRNKTIAVVDVQSGNRKMTLVGNTWATCVSWSGDNRRIAVGDIDGAVMIWSTQSGKCTNTFYCGRERVDSVQWSHDSTKILVVMNRGLSVWHATTGKGAQLSLIEEVD